VRTIVRLAALIALALALTPAARAATTVPRLDLRRITLDPAARGSLVVGDGEVALAGDYRVTAALGLEHEPLVVTSAGAVTGNGFPGHTPRAAIVEDRLELHLAVAYTFWQRLELSVKLPVARNEGARGLEQLGIAAPQTVGIATPAMGVRYGVLAQDDDREGRIPVSLAIAGDVLTPWGSSGALAGQDGTAYGARLEMGRRFRGLVVAAQGGYVHRTRPIEIPPERPLGDELDAGLVLATTGQLRVEAATLATYDLGNRRKNLIETLGLRYIVGSGYLDLFALGGPGLGHLAGTPTWFAMVGFAVSGRAASSGASAAY